MEGEDERQISHEGDGELVLAKSGKTWSVRLPVRVGRISSRDTTYNSIFKLLHFKD